MTVERLALFLSASLVVCGCQGSSPPLTPANFASQVSVRDRNGHDIGKELFVRPNEGIELYVSFLPGKPNSEDFTPRQVKKSDQWRLFPLFSMGGSQPVRPNWGFDELYSFDWVGSEELPLDESSSKPVTWKTIWPPPEVPKGHDQYWARVHAPMEPGKYQLSIVIYPTADPAMDLGTPELGRGAVLSEIQIQVSGATVPSVTRFGREQSPKLKADAAKLPAG